MFFTFLLVNKNDVAHIFQMEFLYIEQMVLYLWLIEQIFLLIFYDNNKAWLY